MRLLTPQALWDLPRVGPPHAVADGRLIVPVTTYASGEAPTTRLWRADPEGGEKRRFATGRISGVSVSPDRARIAYLAEVTDEESGQAHNQVHVQAVDGGEGTKVADLPLGAVGVKWLPDGRLVALATLWAEHPTLETTRQHEPETTVRATESAVFRYWDSWIDHVYHPVLIDPSHGSVADLTPGWTRFWRWPSTDHPIDDLDVSPDRQWIVFSVDDSPPPHRDLSWSIFAVDLSGGQARRLDPDRPGHSRRPRFSPDGKLVYGYQAEADYYASPVELIELDGDTGGERRLAGSWDRSPAEWIFESADTLLLSAEDNGRSRLFRLRVDRDEPTVVTSGGWSTDPTLGEDGTVFYLYHDLASPPEIRLLPDEKPVTDFTAAALSGITLGDHREVVFDGADGDPVQMWLLDPPGAPADEPLPLVHLLHGGPHGSFGDAWHWRWCAQVVAAAGYRVAMVNFHGSTGWGDAFARSIHGAWGDRPYRDIEAASDHLIGRGLADPERMAVTGGSYGGYLTAWITSQTDRYACAVAHAAVTNLVGMYASDLTYGRARAYGAEVWDDRARIERWSPAAHSTGYQTPTLVVHGRKDARVPDNQGLQLYGVLVAKGVPARLVFFPEENHWVLSRDSSVRWYGEFLGWLERWL